MFDELCTGHCIDHEVTASYKPQHNGIEEIKLGSYWIWRDACLSRRICQNPNGVK